MLINLPILCYSENDGQVVIIKRGEEGYYPYSGSKQVSDLGASKLNELIGVTEMQAMAMTSCSMFGWDAPVAVKKFEVTEEQAKKQELTAKLIETFDEVIAETQDIKVMEHKLQEVIEEVYVGKAWWETTNHFQLFNELVAGWNVEVLMLMLVASIK